jgi:hypothetical protein
LVAFGSELVIGADDDDGGVAAEGLEEGDPVDPRELEVEKDGVKRVCREELQGGRAIVDLEAVFDASDTLEVALDKIADERVVINNEAFHREVTMKVRGFRMKAKKTRRPQGGAVDG